MVSLRRGAALWMLFALCEWAGRVMVEALFV